MRSLTVSSWRWMNGEWWRWVRGQTRCAPDASRCQKQHNSRFRFFRVHFMLTFKDSIPFLPNLEWPIAYHCKGAPTPVLMAGSVYIQWFTLSRAVIAGEIIEVLVIKVKIILLSFNKNRFLQALSANDWWDSRCCWVLKKQLMAEVKLREAG